MRSPNTSSKFWAQERHRLGSAWRSPSDQVAPFKARQKPFQRRYGARETGPVMKRDLGSGDGLKTVDFAAFVP